MMAGRILPPFFLCDEVIMEQYFRVGVLTKEHGLKGEIKVFPTTDDVTRFQNMKRVFIDMASGKGSIKGKGFVEVEVESVKFFKNMVILKFKEMNRIEEVAKFKGMDLLIAREDATPLEEGQYYVPDIIGCKIVTEEGEEYGEVTDVLDTGANKVLVVEANEEHKHLKEFCLPYIPDCVKEINVAERWIKVFMMRGLLD